MNPETGGSWERALESWEQATTDRPGTEAPEARPRIQRVVEAVVLFSAAGLWGVVGLFLWIPLLARAVCRASAAVLYATLTEDRTPLAGARAQVQEVSDFWLRGFRNARSALEPPDPDDPDDLHGLGSAPGEVRWLPLVTDIVWAVIFWFAAYLIVS